MIMTTAVNNYHNYDDGGLMYSFSAVWQQSGFFRDRSEKSGRSAKGRKGEKGPSKGRVLHS